MSDGIDTGDPLRPVVPGQDLRISASVWNAMLQMVREWQRGRGSPRRGAPAASAGREDSITILVQNDSGADVDQFAVLTVGDPIVEPADSDATWRERRALVGVSPTATGPFCIVQEPIADGAIGKAVVLGVTPAFLNIDKNWHEYAKPIAGDSTALQTAADGPARILWKEDTSGDGVNAVVLLQESDDCKITQKMITGVCITGGAIKVAYKIVCFSSGRTLFAGCENAPSCDDLPCDDGGGEANADCCPASITSLQVTFPASDCAALSALDFSIPLRGQGTLSTYYEGGEIYATTTLAEFGGKYTHRYCTVTLYVWCSGVGGAPGDAGEDTLGTVQVGISFLYWVEESVDHATPKTYAELMDDGTIPRCIIGHSGGTINECFTGSGQTRSIATKFFLSPYFADCETNLGASPCCETDGFTFTLDLDS